MFPAASFRCRTPAPRGPRYRPELLELEARLPLGDGVLGLFLGAALRPHTAPAVVPPNSQSAATPSVVDVGRLGHTDRFAIRPTEATFTTAPLAVVAAPDWTPLTDSFAAAQRRQFDALVSPSREQGPDTTPAWAFRAGEERSAALLRVSTPVPAAAAAAPHADEMLRTLAALYQPEAPARAAEATPTQEARIKENFGKLPLTFEENVGQTDATVHFFTRGPGYGLYLTGTEAVMVLSQPTPTETNDPASDRLDAGRARPLTTETSPVARPEELPAVVRLQFVGANPTPAVTGLEKQPGTVNYILGNDSAKWHTNIATFGRVQYDDVYPGIDLVYYGHQRQLEYDFVVTPGADPNQIRLGFSGAERMEIDAAGDLVLTAGRQELRQHRPFTYQEVNGVRQEVASRFVLAGGQVRFEVAAYDAGRPLVIDPVLAYSTYLGGSGGDLGESIAVDPITGNAFLTGFTGSPNFPTANPFQPDQGGSSDAFVAQLTADGSALVWSTYLGGSRRESGYGIALDGAGNAFVAGTTESRNFPTVNPLQPEHGGGTSDAFVAQLTADGSALVYSSYLGGSGSFDSALRIAVDPTTGNAFVTGDTSSRDFPTANALQPAFAGGRNDVFVTQITADGSALVWSTYLGGADEDVGNDVAVDPNTGNVFVTGGTASRNFPTAKPVQPTYGGGFADVFVSQLTADGSALVWSTYLGGNLTDRGYGIALDGAGQVVLTGQTNSSNFPTVNPFQPQFAGGVADAFATQIAPDGAALAYSTYLGGRNTDFPFGIAVDPNTDDLLIVGETQSQDFPTANPIQPNYGGGQYDTFVSRVAANEASLVYSTYLGGSGADRGRDIAVDGGGNAFVTGQSQSANFPLANPFQRSNRGGIDAFVTRIASLPVASYSISPDSGSVQAGVPFDLSVYALDDNGFGISDYTGAIAFFSTDKQATLPEPYTFQRTDQGVAYFAAGVTLVTQGTQELYVFDTATYKVWGYAVFDVV